MTQTEAPGKRLSLRRLHRQGAVCWVSQKNSFFQRKNLVSAECISALFVFLGQDLPLLEWGSSKAKSQCSLIQWFNSGTASAGKTVTVRLLNWVTQSVCSKDSVQRRDLNRDLFYPLYLLQPPVLQGFGASTVFLEESPGLMSTQRNRLFSQLSGQNDSNWTDEQKIKWRQILKNCFTLQISISWPEEHSRDVSTHCPSWHKSVLIFLGSRKECSNVDKISFCINACVLSPYRLARVLRQ